MSPTATAERLRAALLTLTPAQAGAVEALAAGATHAVAAEAAGVTRETVTRWAGHSPAFRAALARYRLALVAEQADTACRIRGRALAIVEAELESADLPTALAVLKVVPAAEIVGPTDAAAIIDAETRRTRLNLPLTSGDVLDMLDGPTDDERAARLTVERLAAAAGLEEG